MSIELVRNEIARFLKSPDPEVLCIKGDWGVGKTYTWKKFLEDAARTGNVELEKYSYISLYGIKNLEDVKASIFREQITRKDLASRKTNEVDPAEVYAKSIGGLYKRAKRHFPAVADFFGSKGKAVSTIIQDLAYQSVRQQIICFDDLERSGSGIAIRDIMGLSTFLKEDRGCKIALLLNDKKMKKKERKEFDSQFEKVVDSSLSFIPTTQEAVDIGLDGNSAVSNLLSVYLVAAEISNIRIIKKIERLCAQIRETLELDDDLTQQVCQTITVASVIKYDFNDQSTLDDLRHYNSIAAGLTDDQLPPPFVSLLERAEYGSTDEADLMLIDAVEHGYVDYDKLKARFEKLQNQRKIDDRNSRFSRAWDGYHHTLTENDDDIVKELYEAVISEPETVTLLNLNGTVSLFRELGYTREAETAVRQYFRSRDFDRNALKDDVLLWREGPVDPAVQLVFDKLNAEFVDTRDPAEVLNTMAENQGWNNEDIELLASLSPDTLVNMFDRLQGENLTRCLRMASRFVGSDSDQYRALGKNLAAAFETIAGRSKINKRKLQILDCIPNEDA